MIVDMRRVTNHHYTYKGRTIRRVPSEKPYNPWKVEPYWDREFSSLKAAADFINALERKK